MNKFDFDLYLAKSQNIIDFKITNASNEVYFLVVNPDRLESVIGDIKTAQKKVNYLRIDLLNDDEILGANITLLGCGNYDPNSLWIKKLSVDSLWYSNLTKKNLYKNNRVGMPHRIVLEKNVVIHPGETKYFTSIVNLPYQPDIFQIIKIRSKPNFARLCLFNYQEYTETYLSKFQKREIIENRYTVFDGKLVSNKIPVRFIPMKE